MSDDLVKRLRVNRASLQMWLGEHLLEQYEKERTEAADRIEQLGEERDNAKYLLNQYLQLSRKASDESDARIEKLEAALRDIVDERGICGHCGQLATGEGKRNFVICDKTVLGFKGPCHWTPQDPKDIARKALEGEDE